MRNISATASFLSQKSSCSLLDKNPQEDKSCLAWDDTNHHQSFETLNITQASNGYSGKTADIPPSSPSALPNRKTELRQARNPVRNSSSPLTKDKQNVTTKTELERQLAFAEIHLLNQSNRKRKSGWRTWAIVTLLRSSDVAWFGFVQYLGSKNQENLSLWLSDL
jgi:hypothetical protein